MTTVTVYRVVAAEDPEPIFHLIDEIADRAVHAVTFTSAPAVAALMDAAGSTGRREDVVGAFQSDVIAACVGPVTAAAFEMWCVPTIYPERARLVAMVKQLESELPSRSAGLSFEVELSPAPAPGAVLQALLVNPVVKRGYRLAVST